MDQNELGGLKFGNPKVLESIKAIYAEQEIAFREIEHEPTRTSEESANVRGEPLQIGGKALVMKVDTEFKLFVLPANRKTHSNSIKRYFGAKSLRFASFEELNESTGLVPGSVPPFGAPVLPFELFMDEAFQQNERIAFNAGMLTVSHILAFDDYCSIAHPTFFPFSKSQ